MKKTLALIQILKRYFRYALNPYIITILATISWMLLLDRYDLISQYRMQHNIKQLEVDKQFYQREISKVKTEYDILLNDPLRIERYARENYWMKRPNEDIYIFKEIAGE